MTHLDPELDRLGAALRASATIDLAREERTRAPATTRAPRTGLRARVFAGSTLGLAGIGAALVLLLGGTAATTPAFAITKDADGVLVHLNYTSNQNLPQVDAKLASMGIHENVGIQMAPGAATVSGPVTCIAGPGVSGPAVRVLVGANGTETIAAGQSAGNTAEGSFHLVSCVTSSNTAGNTGYTGNS